MWPAPAPSPGWVKGGGGKEVGGDTVCRAEPSAPTVPAASPGAGGCPKPRPTSVIGRRGVKPGDLERLARVRLDGEPAKKRQRTMESFLSSPKSVVG